MKQGVCLFQHGADSLCCLGVHLFQCSKPFLLTLRIFQNVHGDGGNAQCVDIGGVLFQNAVQLRKCSFVMLVDQVNLSLQAVGIQMVGILPYHRIQPGVDFVLLPSAECDDRILQQRVTTSAAASTNASIRSRRARLANYVQHHLSDAIKTEDIAGALYMSRPYLSKKFKEETGENIADFILKEKTEEAKRLLRYSDKPITAISSYLGFSSPSHFSRVFKAYVGSTPREYREKYL